MREAGALRKRWLRDHTLCTGHENVHTIVSTTSDGSYNTIDTIDNHTQQVVDGKCVHFDT